MTRTVIRICLLALVVAALGPSPSAWAQVSDDFSKVTIFVANRFKLDWVRAQYSSRIASLLEKRGRLFVVMELASTDDRGRLLVRGRMTGVARYRPEGSE